MEGVVSEVAFMVVLPSKLRTVFTHLRGGDVHSVLVLHPCAHIEEFWHLQLLVSRLVRGLAYELQRDRFIEGVKNSTASDLPRFPAWHRIPRDRAAIPIALFDSLSSALSIFTHALLGRTLKGKNWKISCY